MLSAVLMGVISNLDDVVDETEPKHRKQEQKLQQTTSFVTTRTCMQNLVLAHGFGWGGVVCAHLTGAKLQASGTGVRF